MAVAVSREDFYEISPADFFYRNRDIAGFSNPARALYSAVRELVENSLDAGELARKPPDIYVRLSCDGEKGEEGSSVYTLRVEDNGSGVPARNVPQAFGQVFYGSKYRLRQARGTFGLGGTMAILYGQITTNSPVRVISSADGKRIHDYTLMIDIRNNRPIVLKHKVFSNHDGWRGTAIETRLEGEYSRAMPKILEYFRQTAIVAPYANLTFVDPKGRLYRFERATEDLPRPPVETKPHPYGIDVETMKRMIAVTQCRDMASFLREHFHRIGRTVAIRFLVEEAKIPPRRRPKKLSNEEIVKLVKAMKRFNGFRAPSADCLSPLGVELFKAGIVKELNPEFVSVKQRPPSVYLGYPFIVEVAVAYGGGIPRTGDIVLYRFANRIPLLYDEASDVAWKVVHHLVNWRYYKVDPSNDPVAVFIHVCSTKIPYRSVGKEFMADVPEIEREILNGVRDAVRDLSLFLSKKIAVEREKQRLDIFEKYLPKIARFSAELAGRKPPDIKPLLKSVVKYDLEEGKEDVGN
ncbi:MAG: DNA topoisomerase VI subunit B [Candidatus Hecatellaceae archaeon]